MTERDHIIAGMSDEELLMFLRIGGRIPAYRRIGLRLALLSRGATMTGVVSDEAAPPLSLAEMRIEHDEEVARRLAPAEKASA